MRKAWRCCCYSLGFSVIKHVYATSSCQPFVVNHQHQQRVKWLVWFVCGFWNCLVSSPFPFPFPWFCLRGIESLGWIGGRAVRFWVPGFMAENAVFDCRKREERRSTGIDPLSLAVFQPCVVALDWFASPHLISPPKWMAGNYWVVIWGRGYYAKLRAKSSFWRYALFRGPECAGHRAISICLALDPRARRFGKCLSPQRLPSSFEPLLVAHRNTHGRVLWF